MSTLVDTGRLANCLSDHSLFISEDDIQETSSKVGQIFRPHRLGVVGTRQRLSAAMNHTSIGRISLSRLSYGAAVSIDSDPLASFCLVMMPLRGSAEISHGKQSAVSTPSVASVIGFAAPLSMRWHAQCQQLILRIDREVLESTCAAHLGHELSHPLEFDLEMNLSESRTASLQSVVSFLASTDPFIQSANEFPLIIAQTEQLLICALLAAQPHNFREELLRPSPVIAPYYVKRCEEYIFAHVDEPVSVGDLASYAGVSVRSLQIGFQRYRGMSPMLFLKDLRLQRVRDELLCAKLQNKPETVTRVALAWGFCHLGHFSRAYAAKFKELPSQTLLC